MKNGKIRVFVKYLPQICAAFILLLTVLGALIYRLYGNAAMAELRKNFISNIEGARTHSDDAVKQIDTLALRLLSDANVLTFFQREDETYYDATALKARVIKTLGAFETDNINSVYVYSEPRRCLLNGNALLGGEHPLVEEYRAKKHTVNTWVSEAEDGQLSFYYLYPLIGTEKRGAIVVNIAAGSLLSQFPPRQAAAITDNLSGQRLAGEVRGGADVLGFSAVSEVRDWTYTLFVSMREYNAARTHILYVTAGIILLLAAFFFGVAFIFSLILQGRERGEALRQTQTAALAAQINPHFLYNTLQTINWLVIGAAKGANPASAAIETLSSLLRVTISSETQCLTVAEELRYAEKYMELCRIRFGEKIVFEVDVREEALPRLVPKMTLQPVLENAINHGRKRGNEKSVIKIRAEEDGTHAVITVTDNGAGMDEARLARLNAELDGGDGAEGNHIGLKNVNARLKLIFGGGSGVRLRNAYPGLEVKITITKQKNEKMI
ncbi:MAG: histidine kinase [Clostridiales bacterium]|jgi:signal transduction histidine kinase|nr:histidine kinase [Clostridiales bacterium]